MQMYWKLVIENWIFSSAKYYCFAFFGYYGMLSSKIYAFFNRHSLIDGWNSLIPKVANFYKFFVFHLFKPVNYYVGKFSTDSAKIFDLLNSNFKLLILNFVQYEFAYSPKYIFKQIYSFFFRLMHIYINTKSGKYFKIVSLTFPQLSPGHYQYPLASAINQKDSEF